MILSYTEYNSTHGALAKGEPSRTDPQFGMRLGFGFVCTATSTRSDPKEIPNELNCTFQRAARNGRNLTGLACPLEIHFQCTIICMQYTCTTPHSVQCARLPMCTQYPKTKLSLSFKVQFLDFFKLASCRPPTGRYAYIYTDAEIGFSN